MSERRVLVIGASGYIGGTVLDRFLKSTVPAIKSAQYTAPVRNQAQAELLKKHNVNAVLFENLNDVELLRKYAAENDVVLNSADAFNKPAAEALIKGLSERQQKTGIEAIYLHTSGTSSLGHYPVPQDEANRPVVSDLDDVYAHLQKLEQKRPYAQRTTDVGVVDAGAAANVKTYIVMSPTIYGPGSGLFNRLTIQVPALIRRGLHRGKTPVHSTGAGNWDHVHVADLAALYEIIFDGALNGRSPPSGRKGIYFSENGYHNWLDLSRKIAATGVELGALKTDEIESLDPETWVTALGDSATPASIQANELGLASWSRTTADLGRSLGWKPEHGEKSWIEHIKPTFQVVWDQEKSKSA